MTPEIKKSLDLALEALEEVAARTGARWALEQGYAGHLEAITAIKQARALDKKAENARELGLDYEPSAKVRDFWEGYVPEPQYSVNCVNHDCDKCKAAARPAVPDAFGTREGEHPQYIQGWNDCRAEMLRGMKP